MSTPTPLNETLSDELLTINSIYAEDTLIRSSSSSNANSPTTSPIFNLRLPSLDAITLRIQFPPTYPDAPPSILGTHSVGDELQKGTGTKVVALVREILDIIFTPGEPCVFDLLEEVRDALEKADEDGTLQLHDRDAQNSPDEQETNAQKARAEDERIEQLGAEPPWILAPQVTEKKSVFLARAARVSSPAQAKSYVAHLLATDKKAAKATHNITAWRIRGPNDTSYQDCDDDGETAAGGRMLHLMQLMDVWDVCVVVTRWYGGVQLGPDRFRIINTTAREALVLGGFVEGKEGVDEGKKKGKR